MFELPSLHAKSLEVRTLAFGGLAGEPVFPQGVRGFGTIAERRHAGGGGYEPTVPGPRGPGRLDGRR